MCNKKLVFIYNTISILYITEYILLLGMYGVLCCQYMITIQRNQLNTEVCEELRLVMCYKKMSISVY